LCISTGRTCDGYGLAKEAGTDHSYAGFVSLNRSLSTGFIGTEKECYSFYYYQQNTAPQLSDFLGGNFWERLLPQAALQDTSIKHAVLAIGSLHASIEQKKGLVLNDQSNGWSDDFTLRNYSQAINLLSQSLSDEDEQAIDVCLICSVLFACLEVSVFHAHVHPCSL
jgi:hypothetical protein